MNFLRQLFFGLALYLTLGLPAQATLLFSGTFNIQYDLLEADYQGIPSISGSFSGTFDDSVVTGVGFENFGSFAFDSFTLNPGTIGATDFDINNVEFSISYNSGVLAQIYFGGILTNGPGDVTFNEDDFSVYIIPTLDQVQSALSVSTLLGGSVFIEPLTDDVATLDLTRIPVPATLSLLVFGLIGLRKNSRHSTEL